MAEVRPHLPALRAAGADLVIVGTGSPAAAAAFGTELGLAGVRVWTDPRRRAFELAAFRRGLRTLLSPRAIGNYVRAFFSGHRPGRKDGDALQQGGAIVVAPDGTMLYRWSSRVSGDHPDPLEILAAVEKIRGR